MDINNFDLAGLQESAMDMVERQLAMPPYSTMSEEGQLAARVQLLPIFLKTVTDLRRQAEQDARAAEEAARAAACPLPPPPYDPNVASALYKTTNCLRQLSVRTAAPNFTMDQLACRGLSLRQATDFK
jgi:hypothetical protein